MAIPVQRPEIVVGGFVRLGKSKHAVIWKVTDRTATWANLKDPYLGTVRRNVDVRKLTSVSKDGDPQGVPSD